MIFADPATGCSQLGRQSVAVDGNARTIAKGWGLLAKKWSGGEIAAIRLDIGQVGQVEQLELAIETTLGARIVLLLRQGLSHTASPSPEPGSRSPKCYAFPSSAPVSPCKATTHCGNN